MKLALWLMQTLQENGHKTVLYFGKGADQTNGELARSVAQIATWLIEQGLKS